VLVIPATIEKAIPVNKLGFEEIKNEAGTSVATSRQLSSVSQDGLSRRGNRKSIFELKACQ